MLCYFNCAFILPVLSYFAWWLRGCSLLNIVYFLSNPFNSAIFSYCSSFSLPTPTIALQHPEHSAATMSSSDLEAAFLADQGGSVFFCAGSQLYELNFRGKVVCISVG